MTDPARPDDIRARGWRLALHYETGLGANVTMHWLFTRGSQAVKGEGPTDADALNEVRQQLDPVPRQGANQLFGYEPESHE